MAQSDGNRDVLVGIEDLMHEAYLQYSLSVNVGRAIPDVRDGLKPVNRRILYGMRQLNLTHSRPYAKCAKVVGEVIGNYHPHGDQAVYDTLVRMAQDFNMRHMLIDGQGNFGNIDGDAPAAYRYTECRMERLAEEMLAEIERDTVDMQPTFDEENTEPVVLPAKFPNLLVNGGMGIGVGMASNIPPHNLGEVVDAAVHLVDYPAAGTRQLLRHLKGPDFPTGGTVLGFNSIAELYETGRGTIKVRGKAEIEEDNTKERIIIKEMPYAVNKERLVTEIANLVNEKKIEGISNLTDESSNRTGIRVVMDIKKGAMANVVLNQLYAHTCLEVSFGTQFLVVDGYRPKTMNLKQLLQAYLDHRLDVVTRRAQHDLQKAQNRAHVLEGLLKAVDNIDETVRIIRESRTRQEAANGLMEKFDLSERQTNAILDMRLHQLTGLAREELQSEYDELLQTIAYLKELLADRNKRLGVVKDELLEIKEKYATERRTELKPTENEFNVEDLIERTSCVVTLSETGYIKRVAADTYRTQHRGGKGVRGMSTKEEDAVANILTACTHDYVLFFTNHGRMHSLKAYNIPETGRDSGGKALVNLIDLQPEEHVQTTLAVDKLDDPEHNIVMATRKGIVKKTGLNKFKNIRRKGIRAITLDEDDDLIDARLTDGNQEILLSTAAGAACRFKEQDIRETGRNSRGVRGIELRDENGNLKTHVVSMTIVDPNCDLLVVTANGLGKRTNIGTGNSEQDKDIRGGYRLTRRGGKGVKSIQLKAGDEVVGALPVKEDTELILTSQKGQTVRISANDVRPMGRTSQGLRVMRPSEGDRVTGVSQVKEVTEDELEPEE